MVARFIGKVRTCAGGDLYAGPDWGMLIVSTLLGTVPVIVVLAVVASSMWVRLPLIVVDIATVVFLFATAFSDPGIIPRQPPLPPIGKGGDPGNFDDFEEVTKEVDGRLITHKVLRRWCYTCHLLRPPRASHCSRCDCCIERHDHHCPWTGTCIGGRNYRYFYGFLVCATLVALYSLVLCVAELALAAVAAGNDDDSLTGGDQAMSGAAKSYYMSVLMGVYAALLLCCVGPLCCYHSQLIAKEETTHERIRGKNVVSPYDQGCPQNTRTVLCGPRSVSRVPPYLRGDGLDGADLAARDRVYQREMDNYNRQEEIERQRLTDQRPAPTVTRMGDDGNAGDAAAVEMEPVRHGTEIQADAVTAPAVAAVSANDDTDAAPREDVAPVPVPANADGPEHYSPSAGTP